jgi:signal transduction histidine kinase
MKLKFSQTLLQSQIEIQEQTLQHISRELHDNLGQVASLIKINLTTLKLNDPEKAVEKIEHTKDLTRQLIADIKSLSVSLGSDRIAQTGLARAIETEVERLNKTGEFVATYRLQGAMPDIDADKSLILYRMAQEVLNNMVKHSEAKHINIFIHVNENVFILAFRDDGIGFNSAEKMNASGAGLRNLQNRATLINAQLHIQSLPGNGTEITIEMPF